MHHSVMITLQSEKWRIITSKSKWTVAVISDKEVEVFPFLEPENHWIENFTIPKKVKENGEYTEYLFSVKLEH